MDVLNIKFYTICFLDSLTLGLYLPILSSHITSLGGNHTILGILASLYAIVRLFAGSLIYTWTNKFGRKITLLLSLFINYLVYFPFGTTEEYMTIILLRLTVALCNQTQNICNSFIAEVNDKDKLSSIYSITNVVSVAGLVVGPMIGGALFEEKYGFYYISRLSTTFLFICLVTAIMLPPSTIPNDKPMGLFQKVLEDLKRKFGKILVLNLGNDWDIVVQKFLHSASATVFFMKFSMMLKIHFQLSAAIIGCMYAYQGSLTFLATFIVAFLNNMENKDTRVISLFALAISLMGLCFGATLESYLIWYIPMIIVHTFLNSIWKKIFKQTSNENYNIEGAEDGVGEVASIITPVIFGVFCDLYGLYALKAFVIIPILLSIFITIISSSRKVIRSHTN
ncbi:hypothetical protein RN001_000414 [Aquatica leii]|uniref:Major facilitator superfamily (MFS) profile domain-containing protein n=1 Tax=Aquatica leii TaxID=1421715 RepID=A0AAN7SQJ3_9COLE|nr:hypothetical protein RN001_000414 [Aquatica leii]